MYVRQVLKGSNLIGSCLLILMQIQKLSRNPDLYLFESHTAYRVRKNGLQNISKKDPGKAKQKS